MLKPNSDTLRGAEVRLWTRSGILNNKSFSNNYYTALTAAAGPPQVCDLNDLSRATCFFCLAGLVGGSPIENLTPIVFVFKNIFFLKHHGYL